MENLNREYSVKHVEHFTNFTEVFGERSASFKEREQEERIQKVKDRGAHFFLSTTIASHAATIAICLAPLPMIQLPFIVLAVAGIGLMTLFSDSLVSDPSLKGTRYRVIKA